MQQRSPLKLDSLFTPVFFHYSELRDSRASVNFQLPESDATLSDYLKGPDGKKLKKASAGAIERLGQWAQNNNIDIKPLVKFQKNYVEYSGSNPDENLLRMPFYTESVPALIYISDNICQSTLSLDFRRDLVSNLISSFGVCAPGTHTNIMNAYIDMISQLNLPIKLMSLRKHIAEQYIQELLPAIKIHLSYEIHYVNAVLHHFSEELGIRSIDDKYENVCDPQKLQHLIRLFKKDITAKLSPEAILNALVTDLDYEELPAHINDKTLSYADTMSGFEAKLSAYGLEESTKFFYADDLVEANDDYTQFKLSWSAPYMLTLTIMQRLRVSGYFSSDATIIGHGEVSLHLLLPHSLKLSFVQFDDDPDHRTYQPFLTYSVKALANHDETIMEILLTQRFKDQHRHEVAVAMMEYVASLPSPLEEEKLAALSKYIPQLISVREAIMMLNNDALRLYIDGIDYSLLAKSISKRSILDKVLTVMTTEEAKSLFILLHKMNKKKIGGRSLLWHACSHGNLEAVLALWKTKAYVVREIDKNGETPLFTAAEFGHVEVVRMLLGIHTAHKHQASNSNMTPLNIAAYNGHVEVVRLLLANNAETDIVDDNNKTALQNAVEQHYAEVVRVLLEYDADISVMNDNNESLYEVAILQGDLDTLNILILYGQTAGVFNKIKDALLSLAVNEEANEIVAVLLRNGANPNQRDLANLPLLTVAIERDNIDLAQLLIDHGAVNYKDDMHDASPFHAAVAHGYLSLVTTILDKGVHIDSVNSYQETALHLSIILDQPAITQLLLERKANVNMLRQGGESPLFLAAKKGELNLVNELILRHAMLDQHADNGKSPLSVATENSHWEIVQSLLNHGANPDIIVNEKSLADYVMQRGRREMALRIEIKCLARSPLSIPGSPRALAYRLVEETIERHPEQLEQLCMLFHVLDVIDRVTVNHQPKTSSEVAILDKLAMDMNEFYSHYLETGEPKNIVLKRLQHQAQALIRQSAQFPRFQSRLRFFEANNPFANEIQQVLNPVLKL